jgi:hypothetical protein
MEVYTGQGLRDTVTATGRRPLRIWLGVILVQGLCLRKKYGHASMPLCKHILEFTLQLVANRVAKLHSTARNEANQNHGKGTAERCQQKLCNKAHKHEYSPTQSWFSLATFLEISR